MGIKKEFMYVSTFKDRSGYVRNYFRHPWANKRTPLPGAIGSREFVAAYTVALAEARANQQSQTPQSAEEFFDIPESGVYIMLRGGQVSYIGTSKNMRARVADHRQNGRQFDKVFYISASDADRLELEAALLKSLHTAENRALATQLKRTKTLREARERCQTGLPNAPQRRG